ncbi:BAG family molecular chaperone regulator 2 [Nymphaea thermarum]|nr:BAG family molecular chaperone regulator 2 [Nymphaea thermarum]
MIKLRSRRFWRCSSKLSEGVSDDGAADIEWELRPGGMLVQKRENGGGQDGKLIRVRVSSVSDSHEITIGANATFGEMKMMLSMVTGLEPQEQRLLFKGKEREDHDFLHMVGVKHMDKVLLLEDPASKEMKMQDLRRAKAPEKCCQAIAV